MMEIYENGNASIPVRTASIFHLSYHTLNENECISRWEDSGNDSGNARGDS